MYHHFSVDNTVAVKVACCVNDFPAGKMICFLSSNNIRGGLCCSINIVPAENCDRCCRCAPCAESADLASKSEIDIHLFIYLMPIGR